ncbi:MAG TPA: thioredoxin family protein [Thermoanaerobaculia bacterium]|nr:thioredoxin family protein [Thermoanaerobaculia bacterium]
MSAGRALVISALAAVLGLAGFVDARRRSAEVTRVGAAASRLPVEGPMPPLSGAVAWINSPPVTPEGLRGKVVAVDFWTFTCVNWLRTLPHVRAWAAKYRDEGLVVIGVHSPEFSVEKDLANVRRAVTSMRIDYPVAVDTDFGVWRAFGNSYWPALYLVDAQGRIRFHHFGEGGDEQSERAIQQLLAEAGASGVSRDLVSVDPRGTEVAAEWSDVRSEETYVGGDKAVGFASPGGIARDTPHVYALPGRWRLNEWGLSGEWIVTGEIASPTKPMGRLAYRFHARDVNLVMGAAPGGAPVRWRVLLDGHPPGAAHGTDVDEQGNGAATEPRLYQLIRQPKPIEDRLFEIEFLGPGAETFCFTFG